MGALIQIAAFVEFLAPDFFWICLLTPVFFSLIGFAEAVGLFASRGRICAFELSIFLAYLASIAIILPEPRPTTPPSTPATPHSIRTHVCQGKVQDATE